MICKDCQNKPIARGVKEVNCIKCNKQMTTNIFFIANICENCSDLHSICKNCGKKVEANQGFDIICRDCGSKNVNELVDDDLEYSYFECLDCGQNDR